MVYQQFDQIAGLFQYGLNSRKSFGTPDTITGNPLVYLNERFHVIGKIDPREIYYSKPNINLYTLSPHWLNTGIPLTVETTLDQRRRLKETRKIEPCVHLTGRLKLVRGNTFTNPNNITITDARIEDIIDLHEARKLLSCFS